MERVSTLAAEIRAYCAAHADAKLAGKWARYFTEGYDAWGLLDKNDPFWNEKHREWLERYSEIGLRGFLKLGVLLFPSGKYEEGSLAIRFVKQHLDRFDAESIGSLGKWFEAGIGNWAHTDVLCGEVVSPLLASGRVEPQAILPWRTSPHKYQRRAVPVALLGLLKTDFPLESLLDFVRPMMMDPERVVQQGLGWFLREAWKKQAQPVEALLLEWKDTAPRVIFQYATEKMSPAARLRFRRKRGDRRDVHQV